MLLQSLCEACGLSGNEAEVRNLILKEVQGLVDEHRIDTLGNLITLKRCSNTGAARPPRVMIAAHMDEVGLMVTHIEKSGHLRFSKVGGLDDRTLLSKVVLVGNDRVPGVIGAKPIHLLKEKERHQVVETDQMYIDIGTSSREETERSVKRGDYVAFATRFSRLEGGLVKGKAFDDRAGCAALIELLRGRGSYPFDLYGVFTVQEEVGLRGARVAAYAVEPDYAFAFEGTVCDDSPKKKDLSPTTVLGDGPAITLADRSFFADKRLVKLLVETAEKNGIPYQFKQPMVGATDAGRIHLAREGVPSVAVAVPCRYIHSPVNILSLSDFENLVRLMSLALVALPTLWSSP